MGYGIEYKEGYMGAIAWEGENSHKVFGSDLPKAIRAELKANGIKGVSVSYRNKSLNLKFKISDADFRPFEEYLEGYGWNNLGSWCWFNGENKPRDIFWGLDADDRKKLLAENARRDYDYVKESSEKYSSGYDLNEYYLDDYKMFSDAFIEKVKKAKMIVDSYNFDESNAQVDYFWRGFYENYSVKYKAV